MTGIWILVVAVGIVMVLCFSMVKINFQFSRVSENDSLALEVKALFGLARYRYEIPKIDYKGLRHGVMLKAKHPAKNASEPNHEPSEQSYKINKEHILELYDKFKALIAQVFNYAQWFKDTMTRLRCTEFRWTSQIGTDDAADTAVLTGIGWGLKSSIVGYVFQFIQLRTNPFLHIQPQYSQAVFTTNVSCKLTIRLGTVLVSGFLLGIRFLKARGKRKVLQAAKSS